MAEELLIMRQTPEGTIHFAGTRHSLRLVAHLIEAALRDPRPGEMVATNGRTGQKVVCEVLPGGGPEDELVVRGIGLAPHGVRGRDGHG